MIDHNCPCSPVAVDLAFREAEPHIEREIRDRTYEMNRYLVDYAPVKVFPDGAGFELTKVRFFGDIGPLYDGVDGWREEQRSRPFASGHKDAHDSCGYVWEEVGHGFEEIKYRLMKRDLRTQTICIQDIRTFWEYEQYQNLIFKNLTNITMNMREQLNRNTIHAFSVKHIPTSAGLQTNPQNPYQLPNIAGVEVGRLNFQTLTRLYHPLVREAGNYALGVFDGRPVFGVMASDEVLNDLFYEEPGIREDIRSSSAGGNPGSLDLVRRYNFIDTIRGQFLVIPDMFAPRYRDDGAGNLIRVFPYERDVEIQSGFRPAPNSDYENALYEQVVILTRDLFALRSRPTISSVGGETDFNAETGMFDWKWHNPERWCDPNRRLGFYYANGHIGIEPGDFTDIPSILVKRRPVVTDSTFWPAQVCPPTPPSPCNNDLPTNQGCPCPAIVDCCEDFTSPNLLQFKFSTAITEVATNPITITLRNGGTVTGTVVSVSGDSLAAVIDFGEPVECCPDLYIDVLCITTAIICSANVVEDNEAATPGNRLLRLDCLVAQQTATEVINLKLEDDTFATGTIVAVDTDSLVWEVTVTGNPNNQCILEVCVLQADFATCPVCPAVPATCDPVTGLP